MTKSKKTSTPETAWKDPMPEVPAPHPIASDELHHRFTRAQMLADLSVGYAKQAQAMLKHQLAFDDPYRGNIAVALLIITAVREVVRTANATVKAAQIDEFFAQSIRDEIKTFEVSHPHTKQARDVIAHADEYISSTGKDPSQWFDTTNRFGAEAWTFRIGNKLDIDMVNLVADARKLSDHVYRVCGLWFHIENRLDAPSRLVEDLMQVGIHARVSVENDTMTIDLNDTTT